MNSEPVYEFIRGKGWITKPIPREFPWGNLEIICNTCGIRAGYHGHNGYLCPDRDNMDHGWASTEWS